MSATYAVILVDVVGSRATAGFKRQRNRALRSASRAHVTEGLVREPYAVTAWDEFQSLAGDPGALPRILLDLRLRFRPLPLRVSFGIGRVESYPDPGEAVNVGGSGEAFELAREGMEELRNPRKYTYRTVLRSRDPAGDEAVNLILRLQDTLIERITGRQWETIELQRRTGRQETTARRLGIDESTVSRNLQRGFYWQLEDVERILGEVLRRRYAA